MAELPVEIDGPNMQDDVGRHAHDFAASNEVSNCQLAFDTPKSHAHQPKHASSGQVSSPILVGYDALLYFVCHHQDSSSGTKNLKFVRIQDLLICRGDDDNEGQVVKGMEGVNEVVSQQETGINWNLGNGHGSAMWEECFKLGQAWALAQFYQSGGSDGMGVGEMKDAKLSE
ncbi:hypothetical protein B0H10DRAFT_1961295 [Mycena sp. CBHHK59/15]|nr:hypothetical protein B0H10DRAFT_1961295 [Mycena sp. CBHHK59/15]